MKAKWTGGTVRRTPVHVIYHYYHPLDECQNGGAQWEVIFGEIAPGLFDVRHPKCTGCFAEPLIERTEVVDGPAPV